MVRQFVLLILTILILSTGLLKAQRNLYVGNQDEMILKVNATSLLLRNVSLQLEKQVGARKSFAVGMSASPNGGIPWKKLISSQFGEDQFLSGISYKALEITPEMRFYLSGESGLKGFYLAPYFRFNLIKGDVFQGYYTVEETTTTREVPINIKANFRGVSAGLMIGAQWPIAERFYLDWWIAGGGIGKGNGTISFFGEFSEVDQLGLEENYADINIPRTNTYFYSNTSLARLELVGPWASLRAGLAIGFKF